MSRKGPSAGEAGEYLSRQSLQTPAYLDEVGVEELCSRYGLRSNPFADAPERFFSGGHRRHYLETLSHLCTFGDMLLVVEGDAGVGRSRLLAEFSRVDRGNLDFRSFSENDCRSLTALAGSLWESLRQPVPDSGPSDAIRDFFNADHWQRFSGKRWVLLIDDADQMPADVVQALTREFGRSDRSHAPIPVLVGRSGLAEALCSEVSGSFRWVHRLSIRPLKEAECGQFIKQCLAWAGAEPEGFLDPDRQHTLYLRSDGYFDRLKQVAPPVIMGPANKAAGIKNTPRRPAAKPRAGQAPKKHQKLRNGIWVLLALGLLVVSYTIISIQYEESLTGKSDTAQTAGSETGDVALDEVERLRRAMAMAERKVAGQPQRESVPEPEPETGIGVEEIAPDNPATAISERSGEDKAAVQPGNSPLLPPSLSLPVEAATNPVEPVMLTPRELPPVALTPANPPIKAASPLAEPAEPGPEPASEALASAESPQADPEQSVFEPILEPAFRDRAWIESFDPDAPTVQLLGSFNEETAVAFIQRYPERNFIYVLSTYKDRPWFVVLLDIFESRDAAKAAIAELPAAIRRSGPWIRDVSGL